MAFGKQTDVDKVAAQSDVNRLLKLDKKAWYEKPNLRTLYFFLVPSVLGVEMTSGYDGSILNGLQAVGPWLNCTPASSAPSLDADRQTLAIPKEPFWASSTPLSASAP